VEVIVKVKGLPPVPTVRKIMHLVSERLSILSVQILGERQRSPWQNFPIELLSKCPKQKG